MFVNFGPTGRRSLGAVGLAAATAGVLGLLSACGHSSGTPGSGGALTPGPGRHQTAGVPGGSAMPRMTMPTGSPAEGAARPVSGHTVSIKNFAFSPATLKVTAGTTVTWTNADTDAHTVTSTGSGGPLHSPALATHGTYSYTFTRPGRYAYLCTIHPFMTGTVEVTS
ncbi:cupredoxin family copper-binding protein [Streptomyces sp. AF1A]|jgi:plastocyanin|uniref:cupredoxin domain-containing protein n=1 Tax=Streptomyces sp. AF1A TaxID=3394350 RepID=UPI0039BD6340